MLNCTCPVFSMPESSEPEKFSEPVRLIEPVTVRLSVICSEFNAASDPLVMTFFQFGIFVIIMVGYADCSAHFPYGPIIFI